MKPDTSALKAVFGCLGGIVFFIVGIVVAWSAHHYQAINQPMPNGKGGFMSFRDGYTIALVCFLFSIVFFVCAHKFWRMKS